MRYVILFLILPLGLRGQTLTIHSCNTTIKEDYFFSVGFFGNMKPMGLPGFVLQIEDETVTSWYEGVEMKFTRTDFWVNEPKRWGDDWKLLRLECQVEKGIEWTSFFVLYVRIGSEYYPCQILIPVNEDECYGPLNRPYQLPVEVNCYRKIKQATRLVKAY
jgi:hypothetical protein